MDLIQNTQTTGRTSNINKPKSKSKSSLGQLFGFAQQASPKLDVNIKTNIGGSKDPQPFGAATASCWMDQNEQKAMNVRRQNMLNQSTKPDANQKYVFKSLLRQDYFNQRFQEKELPKSCLQKECQKEILNLTFISQFIPNSDKVEYCQDISAPYLLKYFPYKCDMCQVYTSEILVAQCSSQDVSASCNSPICLGCSNQVYEYIVEQNQPINECSFCEKSMILERDPIQGLHPQSSRFSNIEELDEEQNESRNSIEFQTEGDLQESGKKYSPIKMENSISEAQITSTSVIKSPYKTQLDNFIIRDSTSQERFGFSKDVEIYIKNRPKENSEDVRTRCSLIQMTPRGDFGEGYESARSEGIQLTGIKPKALEFVSPLKSPPQRMHPFSSASTKDQTASGGNTFGLSNCMFKCEIDHGNGSPEVDDCETQGNRNQNYQLDIGTEGISQFKIDGIDSDNFKLREIQNKIQI